MTSFRMILKGRQLPRTPFEVAPDFGFVFVCVKKLHKIANAPDTALEFAVRGNLKPENRGNPHHIYYLSTSYS